MGSRGGPGRLFTALPVSYIASSMHGGVLRSLNDSRSSVLEPLPFRGLRFWGFHGDGLPRLRSCSQA